MAMAQALRLLIRQGRQAHFDPPFVASPIVVGQRITGDAASPLATPPARSSYHKPQPEHIGRGPYLEGPRAAGRPALSEAINVDPAGRQ